MYCLPSTLPNITRPPNSSTGFPPPSLSSPHNSGDSGGPSIATVNNKETLFGVISWTTGCKDPFAWTQMTSGVLKIASHCSWISSNLMGMCVQGGVHLPILSALCFLARASPCACVCACRKENRGRWVEAGGYMCVRSAYTSSMRRIAKSFTGQGEMIKKKKTGNCSALEQRGKVCANFSPFATRAVSYPTRA